MTRDSPAATIEQDAALLGPWAQAFETFCGQPVRLEPLDAADPMAGQRLTFPRVFEPIALIGGIGHFQQSPALVEHVHRMGFQWDADGRVMTVPAPGAFNARLAQRGLAQAGFFLAYANGSAPSMPLGNWLQRYMGGLITVLVNAPRFYALLLRSRQKVEPRWALMSLAHDLSVHALNYHLVPHHLVPHVAVADLASRIRSAIPERYAAWSQPAAAAPLTLTYFYDNDFNRYTYAVWCRSRKPEDFASIFVAPRNYDQLVAALEIRLGETKAGIGDVASGVVGDMAKLAETSFDVR